MMHHKGQLGMPATAAAAPVIDNTQLTKPVLLKCDEEGSITVKISGHPTPVIRWQIGRKKVKESVKYRLKNEGLNHTLVIARVTSDLEQGVWVLATNQYGEDCCFIEVKTYSMLSGRTTKANADDKKFIPDGDSKPSKNSSGRQKRPRGSSHDTHSIMSLDTWKTEMDHRNRMRSVDDFMNGSIDGRSTYSEFINPETNRNRMSRTTSEHLQQNGSLLDRRYSSTEAVHTELQNNSIPPLSMDEQSMASASSIPGTPYEERKFPGLTNSETRRAKTKVKTSKRSRSASLTGPSEDSNRKPLQVKVTYITKRPVSSESVQNKIVAGPEALKPPKPPPPSASLSPSKVLTSESEPSADKSKKKKLRKRTTSKNSILSANSFDKSLDDLDHSKTNPIEIEPNASSLKAPQTLEVKFSPKTPIEDALLTEKLEAASDTAAADEVKREKKDRQKEKEKERKKEKRTEIYNMEKEREEMERERGQDAEVEKEEGKETEKEKKKKKRKEKDNEKKKEEEKDDKEEEKGKEEEEEEEEEEKKRKEKDKDKENDSNDNRITADHLTHITDDNNNDIWGLFGMKLDVLCRFLLRGSKDSETPKNPVVYRTERTNFVTSSNESDNRPATTSADERTDGADDGLNRMRSSVTDEQNTEEKPPPSGKSKKKKDRNFFQKVSPGHMASNVDHEFMNGGDGSPDKGIDVTGETSDDDYSGNVAPKASQDIDRRKHMITIIINQPHKSDSKELRAAPNKDSQTTVGKPKHSIQTSNEDFQNNEAKTFKENNTHEAMRPSFQSSEIVKSNFSHLEKKEIDDIISKTNFSVPAFKASGSLLKPARSEESLVNRKQTDKTLGQVTSRDPFSGGKLRVARSCDRLASDADFDPPLIKRRSFSKEWKVVTLTTKTEEITVVQKGNKDVVQQTVSQNGTKKNVSEQLPKTTEIKYIDSDDSMEDFMWPSPPQLPNEQTPTEAPKAFQVQLIRPDVRVSVPVTSGLTEGAKDLSDDSPPARESPYPRTGIQSRIEALSLYGYGDRKAKSILSDESSKPTAVDSDLDGVPPPINMASFPQTKETSPFVSTTEVVLSTNQKITKNIERSCSITKNSGRVASSVEEDEVFSSREGRMNDVTKKMEARREIRSTSQDMCTQTDYTDDSCVSPTNKRQVITPTVYAVNSKDNARFELVANSCRKPETTERKRVEPNAYYVVENNHCVSPVVVHEYGELLSFCKKEFSVADAEESILKTQQQKMDILRRLEALWSVQEQRTQPTSAGTGLSGSRHKIRPTTREFHRHKSGSSVASEVTKQPQSLEVLPASPTRERFISLDLGYTEYSANSEGCLKRPFSDSSV